MRHVAIDEYYLTEQDESTVLGELRGVAGLAEGRSRAAVAAERAHRRRPRSLRGRLEALRRAASIALAA